MLLLFQNLIQLVIIIRFIRLNHRIVKALPFEISPETTFVGVSEGSSRKIEEGDLS